jgi:hypothetical protein
MHHVFPPLTSDRTGLVQMNSRSSNETLWQNLNSTLHTFFFIITSQYLLSDWSIVFLNKYAYWKVQLDLTSNLVPLDAEEGSKGLEV